MLVALHSGIKEHQASDTQRSNREILSEAKPKDTTEAATSTDEGFPIHAR